MAAGMCALRSLSRTQYAGITRCASTQVTCSYHRLPRASSLHTSAVRGALTKLLMPAMSPTMTEGGIASWKKKPGESFVAGDVLLEIETDKATMDVEAQDDGIMAKIIIDEGAKNVPVNSAIAIVGEEGDDTSGADDLAAEAEKESSSGGASETKSSSKEEEKSGERTAPSESKPATERSPETEQKREKPTPEKEEGKSTNASSEGSSSSEKGDRIFASPLARRLAQEKGIPLEKLTGSGPGGRIVKSDVDSYRPQQEATREETASTSKSTSQPTSSPAASQDSKPSKASSSAESAYTDTPLSNMRKVIASRLTESKQQLPHYYVSIDVEMDKVLRLRQLFNDASEKRANGDLAKAKEAKLSVGDFITKAAGVALQQVPEVNAAWYGDFVRQYHTADISIAVATPTGLLTPIVKNVGGNGLAAISTATKTLASKARSGKLQPQEYQGGSFTISNMGMFGITHFTAIINPPQSAILAIGGTEARLVVDESEEKGWRKAMVMQATISADHRIVDGATAARWMKAFKDALENPLSFML